VGERQTRYGFGPQRIHMQWPGDVLDALLSDVLERKGQPVPDLFIDGLRDADAVRLGQRLQPRGDVDAVAINVFGLGDNVSKVDADAQTDPFIVRDTLISAAHAALNLDRTLHRFDDARKLGQHPVARVLDDSAVMFPDFRKNKLASMYLETLVRPLFIGPHQARIADHISG